MRAFRRLSQILFFGLFVYLILITAYPLKPWPEVHIFLSMDPLIAISTMLASRSFIRELAVLTPIVLVLTLLLGRVFCGWICPMGTTLDVSDRFLSPRRRQKRTTAPRQLKYYILAGLLVTSLLTMQAAYLLDPISLFTRTTVLVFFAPIQMALKWFASVIYHWSGSQGTLGEAATWLNYRMSGWQIVSGTQLYFRQMLPVVLMFAAIVGLGRMSRRYWCRNLCPLGALLGLFAQIPLLKRVVSQNCNRCARCIPDCKMGAIPDDPTLTRFPECIQCFNCVGVCPQDATSFRLRPRPAFREETALDLSRRRVLLGAGAGLAFVAVAKTQPARRLAGGTNPTAKLSSPFLIRPPGSTPEQTFINRCVRCGECMKVCPTGGLQPSLHEAGLEGFWTPVLVPRIGHCEEACNSCGQVCPSRAIEKFSVDDKRDIHIGASVVEKDYCLAWSQGKQCLVCSEYCPYDAIDLVESGGVGCPVVRQDVCVGCGRCEFACPIQPQAAIRVYSLGDQRHLRRQQRRRRGRRL